MNAQIETKENTDKAARITNAVMVSVILSFWEASKKSEKGSKEITDLHHMEDKSMARVWKSLLPKSPEYRTLSGFQNRIRDFVYANTLSGFRDGERLLPTANYREFMEGVRNLEKELAYAVNEFLKVYPDLKEKARNQLNGLFEEKDYPDVKIVRSRYGIRVKVMPVPAPEHFEVELEDNQIEEARKAAADEVVRMMREANKELWYRLHDSVNDIAKRLKHPNGRILEPTLDNLNELLDVMGRLNINGDPNLEALMDKTRSRVAALGTEAFKKDNPEREVARQEAEDIVKAMSAFMG